MRRTVAWTCLLCLAAPAPVSAGAATSSDAPFETVVSEEEPSTTGDHVGLAPRPERHTSVPEDALEALPGAVLLRSGGPLAPSRVEVRGLSGPRVAVDVDGLSMSDPLDGALDAAMLPLFFADSVNAGASTTFAGVSLESAWPVVDLVTLRAGVGTLETLDLSGTAALVADDGSAAVRTGLRVARTSGDFAFTPRSPTGARGTPTVRANNDQARAIGIARARAALAPGLDVETATLLAHHEGGIPGFATAPTDGLRGASTMAALGATLRSTTPVAGGRLVVEATPGLRTTARATSTRTGFTEGLVIDERGLGVRARVDGVSPGLIADAHARVSLASVLERAHVRRTSSGVFALEQSLFGRALVVAAGTDLSALSDTGLLAGAHAGVDGGSRLVRAHFRVVRRSRAPTLDELYAPRGFVEGNPDLAPETLTEADTGVHFDLSRIVTGDITLFGGRLEDAILYVNKNAYVVAPVNTGPVWRTGGEVTLDVRPHRFLGLDTRARLLLSHVEATGAPLPTAPPFHARSTLRLGPLAGPRLQTVVHSRGATSANLYGTLRVAPYTLVDVIAVWPILPSLTLSGALSNILDVRDAQDANLLPLPGRQIFVALEVVR